MAHRSSKSGISPIRASGRNRPFRYLDGETLKGHAIWARVVRNWPGSEGDVDAILTVGVAPGALGDGGLTE